VHDINQGALKFGRFADWVNVNRAECASFIDLMCLYGLIPSVSSEASLTEISSCDLIEQSESLVLPEAPTEMEI
jgi:hypothetical protein